MLDLLMLPLAWLGSLQGYGHPYYLDEVPYRILKHTASGIIIALSLAHVLNVDMTTLNALLLLSLGAGATHFGEGRGVGWILGWWEHNRKVNNEYDGWQKYIPTHRLPTLFLQKYVTTFVRGSMWGWLLLPLAYIDLFFLYMPLIYGASYVLTLRVASFFCMSYTKDNEPRGTWVLHEWLRHVFAFKLAMGVAML